MTTDGLLRRDIDIRDGIRPNDQGQHNDWIPTPASARKPAIVGREVFDDKFTFVGALASAGARDTYKVSFRTLQAFHSIEEVTVYGVIGAPLRQPPPVPGVLFGYVLILGGLVLGSPQIPLQQVIGDPLVQTQNHTFEGPFPFVPPDQIEIGGENINGEDICFMYQLHLRIVFRRHRSPRYHM